MGAELGVTASVFPADAVTEQFLVAQGRGDQFMPLAADEGCQYDTITKRLHLERDAATIDNLRAHAMDLTVGDADADGFAEVHFGCIVIDLSELTPLAAGSPSPDNILSVASLDKAVSQVLIGSCTNSSYQDLMLAATVLDGRTVHPDVEVGIAPGSRQVLNMLAENGALARLIRAGVRILESSCGPCIGQGFSPADGTVSVRTFNRNFAGRTGTKGDEVYLVSPETAVAAALTGRLTDPRELDMVYPTIETPDTFILDDGLIQPPLPADEAARVEIVRGETIVKPPTGERLPDPVSGIVLIKVGDKITTDHIMPAGRLLKFRSNVPVYAEYVFDGFNEPDRPTFAERALAVKETDHAGVIVAGDSYGQGSSREHAALCPMYLGVRVVIAKAIERIHQANLVNFGILPLVFDSSDDGDAVEQGDEVLVENVAAVVAGEETVTVRNVTKASTFVCRVKLTPRQRDILAAGGLLNHTREAQ